MIRYVIAIFASLALLAVPAVGQTIHKVAGADPVPSYEVYVGDNIVLSARVGRELRADGSRDPKFTAWIDRANGRGWLMKGASKLALVGYDPTSGYVYRPLDALPRPNSATRFGVNLEGCTFVDNGSLCPTVEDLAWYVDKAGFRSIRLPFNGFQANNPVVVQRIVDLTNAATARGVPIALDRHDYTWPTPAEQVAWWVPILRKVNNPDLVMIDLMNEPRGFDDPVLTNDFMQWVRDTNLIVAGIRKAGFKHRILVEWPQWSASFRFDKKEGPKTQCGSAACAIDRTPGGLVDPLNRIILSPHRYLDKGASGQSATCTDIPAQAGNLREFAASARKRGYRAVLGEYAFGSYRGIPASCAVLGANVIAALKADSDVWLDAFVWGGGRAWTDNYIFKIEPKKGTRGSVPLPDYVKMVAGR